MHIMQRGKREKRKTPQVFRNKPDLFAILLLLIFFFFARNHHLAGKLKTGMSLMPNSQHRCSLLKNSQVAPTAQLSFHFSFIFLGPSQQRGNDPAEKWECKSIFARC